MVVELAEEEFGGVSWVKLAMVGVTTILATGSFMTTGDIPVVVAVGGGGLTDWVIIVGLPVWATMAGLPPGPII